MQLASHSASIVELFSRAANLVTSAEEVKATARELASDVSAGCSAPITD